MPQSRALRPLAMVAAVAKSTPSVLTSPSPARGNGIEINPDPPEAIRT